MRHITNINHHPVPLKNHTGMDPHEFLPQITLSSSTHLHSTHFCWTLASKFAAGGVADSVLPASTPISVFNPSFIASCCAEICRSHVIISEWLSVWLCMERFGGTEWDGLSLRVGGRGDRTDGSIGVYDKGAGDGVLGMVAYKAKICFMRIT